MVVIHNRFSRSASQLEIHGILHSTPLRYSRNGADCWRDRVFVERPHSEYEEIYLHAYDSVGDAQKRVKIAWRSPSETIARGACRQNTKYFLIRGCTCMAQIRSDNNLRIHL